MINFNNLNTTSNIYFPDSLNILDFKIRHICNNHYNFFLRKKNVVGIGLGFKFINGCPTTIKCLMVFVEQKLPISKLSFDDLILPSYCGITTDVLEIGTPYFANSLIDRVRPVLGGYSISLYNNMLAGSLGCLVQDSNGIYILSNNHIIADNNPRAIGDAILQPGLFDSGMFPQDTIANLDRFVPLKFSNDVNSNPPNIVDCAIAKITSPSMVSPNIAIIDKPPSGITLPKLSAKVQKVGRTTGLTKGIVLSIHGTFSLMGILFLEQIITNVSVKDGDSGSLLLDENYNAMGLIMGNTKLGTSIANPITSVLGKLNVSLITT